MQRQISSLPRGTIHPLPIWSLCWSPDSRYVAGSYGHEGYLWEATTGRPVATLEGHNGNVTALAWSPDGQRLATAADDATVRLWDTTSGTQVFTLRGLRGSVLSVGWSADGLMLAAGANDGTIRLWDATSGSEIDHSPSRLHVLDARLTADPSDVAALRSRADLHARLEQWDEAAADYDRVAQLLPANKPSWFQPGWWTVGKLEVLPYATAGAANVPDPFATRTDEESRPAGEPTRPRWYCAADDPNGYLPVSMNPPILMTRVYCVAETHMALVVETNPVRVLGQRCLARAMMPCCTLSHFEPVGTP